MKRIKLKECELSNRYKLVDILKHFTEVEGTVFFSPVCIDFSLIWTLSPFPWPWKISRYSICLLWMTEIASVACKWNEKEGLKKIIKQKIHEHLKKQQTA